MMRGILVVLLVVAGERGNEGTWERGNEGTTERSAVPSFPRPPIPSYRRSPVPPSRRSAPPPTPFRLPSRRPAVRYGASPVVAPAPVPRPPKPALALTGVLWGPEPAALLLGLPGAEGEVVVHPGETHGSVHVRAIHPHAIELEGMDTTWVLTVRMPW